MIARSTRPRGKSSFALLCIGAALLVSFPAAGGPATGWGDDSSGKSDAAPESKPENTESAPLRGEELYAAFPGLRTFSAPYPLWIIVSLGSRYPYQPFALGLQLDVFATPWLRASAFYSAGATPSRGGRDGWMYSSYAEASLGIAPLRFSDETFVDLPTKDPKHPVKAAIPAYYAVFLEGGALTAFVSPARCTGKCDAQPPDEPTLEPVDMQLFMPFGGLRFVSFSAARLQDPHVKKESLLQVYAHLIGKPFGAIEDNLLNWDRKPFEGESFGWRVGLDTPLVCANACMRLGFSAGRTPVPAGTMFEFHLMN